MAVVPIGAALMHGEAVDEGFAGRDAAEAEARHAVHGRGRAHAVPVDRARLAQAVGDGERHGVALAPAQDGRRDLAIDPGRHGLPAVKGERHGPGLERKFGAAEDRRGGGGRSLHEAAAGNGQGSKRIHRPLPAGVSARISYMPPGCCSMVKFTCVPGLIAVRSIEGATGNSMVIAGQPISGIGLWLRLTLCCAGSTELTVPVPWAPLWPACAICMALCCGGAVSASARMA